MEKPEPATPVYQNNAKPNVGPASQMGTVVQMPGTERRYDIQTAIERTVAYYGSYDWHEMFRYSWSNKK